MKTISRGTTPLLKFDYPFDYGYLTNFTVTLSQDGNTLFKINMGDSEVYTVENRKITIELTVDETMKLKHNFPLEAQLKIQTLDGEVWAGEIEHYQVHRTLDEQPFPPVPPINDEESSI